MAKTKVYQIVINGIKENITAANSLNEALSKVASVIDKINSSGVNIGTNGSNSNQSVDTSGLQEQDKLLKTINATEQRISEVRSEEYQTLLKMKDALSDAKNESDSVAASARISAKEYDHTLNGLKKLSKDIKTVMSNTDLDDEEFNRLNKVLGEVNTKIKELTKGSKDFAATSENIKQVTVSVGGVERTFNSTRDASRQLTQELKAMVINGKEDTKEFQELAEAVHNFEMASRRAESALNDLKASSKGMDDILDTFQSFAALGSVGQGFSAFFGFDDAEMQRSIQKLLALQNALKGIEVLRKQMNTREGIGKFFAIGSEEIDKFISRITGAKVAMNGLTMSTKGATLAVRGFSLALKAIGVGVVIAGLQLLMQAFENISSEMQQAKSQGDALEATLKTLSAQYEKRNQLLGSQFMKGELNNEQFLSQQYRLQTDYLKKQTDILEDRMKLMKDSESSFHLFDNYSTSTYGGGKMENPLEVSSTNWASSTTPQLKLVVENIQEVEKEWKKCNEAVNEGKDYWDRWGSGVSSWLHSIFTTVGDTKRVMEELGKVGLGDFIASFQEANEQFQNGKINAEGYAAKIGELVKRMNSSELLQSVIVNLDKYIPDEKVRESIQNIINELYRLDDAFNMTSAEQVHHWNQVRIDGMKEGADKIKAQLAENERYEIEQYGKTQQQIDLIHKKYNRQRADQLKKYYDQEKSKSKQHAKELENIEKEYRKLKISQMKNGFAKEKAQLEEERRERIKAVEMSEVPSGEKEKTLAEINKVYDQKILDAKRNWSYDMVKTYKDMYSQIEKLTRDSFNTEYQVAKEKVQSKLFDAQNNKKPEIEVDNKLLQNMAENDWSAETNIGVMEAYYKRLLEIEEKANERISQIENERLQKELDFNKKDEDLRHDRQVSMETSALVMENIKKYAEEHNGMDLVLNGTEEEINKLEQQLQPQLEKMRGTLVDAYNKGEIDFKSFLSLVEQEEMAHETNMRTMQNKYDQDVINEQNETQRQRYQSVTKYYNDVLTIIRREERNIDNAVSKAPKRGSWQIIDIAATRKTYKEAISEYQGVVSKLVQLKQKLKADLKANKISGDEFLLKEEEIDVAIQQINDKLQEVKQKQRESIGEFVQSINTYFSAAVDAFQTIMDAVWYAQDTQFDKEQEELDKWNEELDNKLSEQRSIISEHTSAVESMESELATARGSRRQNLIDQINAEMLARKAARKEEKKLEKEKEKAEEKQEELDKKRKKAEYERQILQAIVNGAMSVTYAAMNPWPVPAIPMMALAAATTAAQLAIMSSNKPYAQGGQLDGGVAVGNRHRDGGIKVLGGHAEIEGGEFITNRYTTSKNVDLLSYINSKKKKIDVSDLLEFYGGKGVKKSVTSVSHFKYENGGLIPTLSNEYSLDDRLISAFEQYSERPVYVSVVDINNKQADVKRVQALAGLND